MLLPPSQEEADTLCNDCPTSSLLMILRVTQTAVCSHSTAPSVNYGAPAVASWPACQGANSTAISECREPAPSLPKCPFLYSTLKISVILSAAEGPAFL